MNEPLKHPSGEKSVCTNFPEFDRLNYFYGQMLGARDFTTEQNFFRNKMKMLNRCLHGYGVVCGLEVTPAESQQPAGDPQEQKQQQQEKPTYVAIDCGLALDQHGNELVVRTLLCVDLCAELRRQVGDQEWATIGKGFPVWVSLCYYEHRIERQKATHDDCSNYCTYARIRDAVCVQVTREPPVEDERCEPCCASPQECCVLLARIDNFVPGEPIAPDDIHNEVRRPLALYEPTTIKRINWDHGRWYSEDDAEALLPQHSKGQPVGGGLTIQFSRPVCTETIRPGVVDVWKTDDWSGPSAGDFSSLSTKLEVPKSDWTDEFTIKVLHQGFRNDERILIIIRTDFILDHCGRPVDGNHVGGNVPRDPKDQIPFADVRKKRGLYGPWQSGNGVPGGTFESWFFVGNDPGDNPYQR